MRRARWQAPGTWASRQADNATEQPAGDEVALGWTYLVIGWHQTFLGAGKEDLARALDHFRQAGDLSGQAWAHQDASLACAVMGDWAEAATQSKQALALFRQNADEAGQGRALQVLDNLGWPDLLAVGARLEQAGAPSPPA